MDGYQLQETFKFKSDHFCFSGEKVVDYSAHSDRMVTYT